MQNAVENMQIARLHAGGWIVKFTMIFPGSRATIGRNQTDSTWEFFYRALPYRPFPDFILILKGVYITKIFYSRCHKRQPDFRQLGRSLREAKIRLTKLKIEIKDLGAEIEASVATLRAWK